MGALLLLLAPDARAGWLGPQTFSGTPTGLLDVWATGSYTLGVEDNGTSRVYVVLKGNPTPTPFAAPQEIVGSHYDPGSRCLVMVGRSGTRLARRSDGSTCGVFVHPLTSGDPPPYVSVIKRTPQGGSVMLAPNDTAINVYLSDQGIESTTRNPAFPDTRNVSALYPISGLPFGAAQRGSTVFAFVGLLQTPAKGVWISNTLGPWEWTDPTLLDPVTAVEVFHLSDPLSPPYAVVGVGNVFVQGSRTDPPLTVAQRLESDSEILSLSVNVDGASTAGHGYGMAVVQKPGGARVLMGLVPAARELEVGKQWAERALPAVTPAFFPEQVACVNSNYCVVTGTQGSSSRTFALENLSSPVPTLTADAAGAGPPLSSVQLDENQETWVTLTAPDADGDVVRLGFALSGLPASAVTPDLDAEVPGRSMTLRVQSGAVCRTGRAGSLTLLATDGLKDHAASRNVDLVVRHTVPSVPESVKFEDGRPVPSNGDLGTLRAGVDATPLELRTDNLRSAKGCALTSLDWRAVAGQTGGPTPMRTATGVSLVPPATSCVATERTYDFLHDVKDEEGLRSTQRFSVRQPGWTPLADATLQLVLSPGSAGTGEPEAHVDSTLDCARERQLQAKVSLQTRGGGKTVWSKTVDVAQAVPLSESGFCGRFQVTAQLVQPLDQESDPVPPQAVELVGGGVALDAQPETRVVAECGQRADFTLTPSFPPDACQTPAVSWNILHEEDEPAVQLTSQEEDGSANLLTDTEDLDSRVGKTLRLGVTARMGGQEARGEREVRFTTRPFVELRRRTELPAASETGLVGVSVDLVNTTDCGVSEVVHVETLRGLGYVEGSAKFDGQPLDTVSWNEDTGALSVSGLVLSAGRTGRLTYVARPHLVGERVLRGGTSLRGETISLDEGLDTPPAKGCGCSGSTSGPMLLALGALARAARRRKATTARS